MTSNDTTAALDFERHRGQLTGLGYRMLGSQAEAQDLVQEAYLAKDAVLHSDGGGKRPAALRAIAGSEEIIRFFVGLAGKADLTRAFVYTPARINGQPGYVIAEPDGSVTSAALELRDGLVASISIMRNPEKLGHVLKRSGS